MDFDAQTQPIPEHEKQKEVLDDNARKFVTEPLDRAFLKENGAIPFLLITDWLEVGEDNETKVVYKKFDGDDVQIFLISKTTKDGNRTKEKEKITEERYKTLIGSSIRHVEKKRYEFTYTQNNTSFAVNYDEFVGGKLFMLDVDAPTEEERDSFSFNDFSSTLVEVTEEMQYYGYRVAGIV
ncbi:MAG: hypothetical protein JWO61_73 [Candidatus Saccharibacteria bacterium]|nr:hypothetical protein [Candidatus Saccharibacteria bacterium]